MTMQRRLSRPVLAIVGIAPAILACVLMVANFEWLKSLPKMTAISIAIGASLFVMAWSYMFARAFQRRLDEVERASQGYAMHHGFTFGVFAVAVLLMIPAFMTWVIETANATAVSLSGSTRVAPFLAYVGGFMTLVIVQSVAMAVISAFWWKRRS